jgi:hypothetical protein
MRAAILMTVALAIQFNIVIPANATTKSVKSLEIALAKSNSSNCSAITSVTAKMKKKSPTSTINISRSPARKDWKDAPKGDVLTIYYQNSFHNDSFEMSSSKKIIGQCPGIVAVSFQQHATDGVPPYGLINGQVKHFQCPKGMTYENSPFKWGYFCGA